MKSTLKRESKELEVVEREAIVTSDGSCVFGTGANSFTSRLQCSVQPRAAARGEEGALLPLSQITLPAGISYPGMILSWADEWYPHPWKHGRGTPLSPLD